MFCSVLQNTEQNRTPRKISEQNTEQNRTSIFVFIEKLMLHLAPCADIADKCFMSQCVTHSMNRSLFPDKIVV